MSVMTEPTLADVVAVTEEVWSSFLGTADPLLPGPPHPELADSWSASVTISGEWDGMVSVELPQVGAHLVARTMLMLDESDAVADEDVADAVGELVNMVGGNVKSLMPGPSVLSIPVVAAGRVAQTSDTVEVCRADLVWAGHPVCVSVHVVRSATRN